MSINPQRMIPQNGPLRVAVVGVGGIAGIVIRAIEGGQFRNMTVVGALARTAGPREGIAAPVYSDVKDLAAQAPDLIIELAGPVAFAAHAVELITAANVWSISAKALADSALVGKIEDIGARTGHSLRLLSGALTGLDAVALAAADEGGTVHVRYSNSGQQPDEAPKLMGTAREIVETCGGVNIVATVAFAGVGFEDTSVEYYQPVPGTTPVFTVTTKSDHAQYTVHGGILPGKEVSSAAVSASVLAALKQATSTIWVG